MAVIGSILNIARTAITAHQLALQTTSHNIANVETPGYSRQRASLAPSTPQRYPFGNVGTGVDVHEVERMRDVFLDASYRRDVAARDAYSARNDVLAEIEHILGEPSDTGLASTMDQFWSAWSDLSNNPGNAAAQSVVRQRGSQVAYMLNTYATRIDEVATRSSARAADIVSQINTLTTEFATLNREITSAESDGVQAPDLRDKRDLLADQLSQLAGVRVEGQSNGTVAIYLGTQMLVDVVARPLELRGSPLSLGFVGNPDPALGAGGQLGQMIDVVTVEIPTVKGRLDEIARGLVNGVNEYHASGWTAAGDALGNSNWNPLLGPTGSRVNFFDASFTTAGTIRLSAEVVADYTVIASGDVQNSPGNNNVALALAALRDDAGMAALATRMGANFGTQIGFPAGMSYADHYTKTVSDLGVQASEAATQFGVYDALAQLSDNRRATVNGVSLDEELTLMLRHQQAYTAATRLVTVADEMAQSILSMI